MNKYNTILMSAFTTLILSLNVNAFETATCGISSDDQTSNYICCVKIWEIDPVPQWNDLLPNRLCHNGLESDECLVSSTVDNGGTLAQLCKKKYGDQAVIKMD